jgi:hypothetical protein
MVSAITADLSYLRPILRLHRLCKFQELQSASGGLLRCVIAARRGDAATPQPVRNLPAIVGLDEHDDIPALYCREILLPDIVHLTHVVALS